MPFASESCGRSPAFLGIENSVKGQRWVGISAQEDRLAHRLVQQTGHPDLLCRVLACRSVSPESAKAFLNPKLRDLMPDPSTLKDMDKAVARFVAAVDRTESIAVFADYDVDGACSAALLVDWLRQAGHRATVHVPDRVGDGYGPNANAMQRLSANHRIIICVDCGTTAHEAIRSAGADVIILDHHRGDVELPSAHSIVNPNRQDEDSELGCLCAAGVVFMFLVAVNKELRKKRRSVPDLMSMLDLVAFATVVDMSPLLGLNRAFVQTGLKVMHRRKRPGMRALTDISKIDRAPGAEELSFRLGPRANAGGRMGNADLAASLLCTTEDDEAMAIAERLDELNVQRRALVADIAGRAAEQVQGRGTESALVWAAGQNWHPGITGIVAAELANMANRPAIVIGLLDETGKGSGRSVDNIDLGAAIAMCRHEGLLLKGGGHAKAAGFEVETTSLNNFIKRLEELLALQGADQIGQNEIEITGAVNSRAISVELIESVDKAGPYGTESPEPVFALPDQRLAYVKAVGESHLRLSLEDPTGARLKAMAFRVENTALGEFLKSHRSRSIHLAGKLRVDSYRGRQEPCLVLEDAAPVQ